MSDDISCGISPGVEISGFHGSCCTYCAASCGDPIAEDDVLWPDSDDAVNRGRKCSASVAPGLCGYFDLDVWLRSGSYGACIEGNESIDVEGMSYDESR